MKKVLLSTLVASLLVGCGGGASGPSIPASETNNSVKPTTPDTSNPTNPDTSPPNVDAGQADGDIYFETEPLDVKTGEFDKVWHRTTSGYSTVDFFPLPFEMQVSFANNEFRSNAEEANYPKFLCTRQIS